MAVAIAGLIGVLVGALLVTIIFNLRIRYEEQKEKQRRLLEHKVKEIETLVLLNQKISEILQKRVMLMDEYVSFDAFDDCYITIDDFAYLQSFAAQNSFYLPNFFLEEFFKKIGIPMHLSELGIGTEKFDEISQKLDGKFDDAYIPMTPQDVKKILKMCL